MSDTTNQLLENLNALAAGLFLLTAFGIVAMRQAQRLLEFVHRAIAAARRVRRAAGLRHHSEHLYGVALGEPDQQANHRSVAFAQDGLRGNLHAPRN